MEPIDALEAGGSRPFSLRHLGREIELPDPRTLTYQQVLFCLRERHVPGIPTDIPSWKADLAFDTWRANWDLPDFDSARRLAYAVDKHRGALVYDLRHHVGEDLGDLWRARRWQTLLDLIDHLPSTSWYGSSASMDESQADALAEAILDRRDRGEADPESNGPSLVGWTAEVAMLTNILDAVRGVQHAIVAVNSPKGKAPATPEPSPRPSTPLERAIKRAEHRRRQQAHKSLVARVLPQKSPPEVQVH